MLTQQQQLLYQMMQLQQIQCLQNASKQQSSTADLLSLYQSWILSANMQQFSPFPKQIHSMPTTPMTTVSPQFFQQFPPKTMLTPSPPMSISPMSDSKRKALTINDLVESIPLKRPCPTAVNLSPSLLTLQQTLTHRIETPIATLPASAALISNCLPTSSTANVPDNNEAPAPINSRSGSSSTSDTEPDEFIDVVGDPVPKTKAQRKAHIEFYRKIKLLRNREKKLQCNLCNEIVKNVESTVRAHVASHCSNESMLICKICCYSSGDLNQIFEHMAQNHPKHRACYEDRRNMTQLSELLSTCFPRGGVTKQRTGFLDSVQKVIDAANKRAEPCVNCSACKKDVQVTKEALTRHMNLHHVYRCKKCKSTFQDEEEMQAHCQKSHKIEAPKSATDYHLSISKSNIY